jgi:hypothetical protein
MIRLLKTLISFQGNLQHCLFKFLNPTLGKLIRFFQSMSLQRRSLDINDFLYEFAIRDTAVFVYEHMQRAVFFEKREDLWDYVTDKVRNKIQESNEDENLLSQGFIAEFGTWKGYSINYIARRFPHKKVYGFDTFKGLNEDWFGTSIKKGHFDLGGNLPKVLENVVLFPGQFIDTIPEFLKNINGDSALIVHIDSDTFESADLVLRSIAPKIVKGTIIIFDEFFGYPNFKAHEFKAWSNFVSREDIEFEYIAYTQTCVAVLII